MEQEKNNKGVIALLVVIIVILLALVILLATGTISFKNNFSNNDQQSEGSNQQNSGEINSIKYTENDIKKIVDDELYILFDFKSLNELTNKRKLTLVFNKLDPDYNTIDSVSREKVEETFNSTSLSSLGINHETFDVFTYDNGTYTKNKEQMSKRNLFYANKLPSKVKSFESNGNQYVISINYLFPDDRMAWQYYYGSRNNFTESNRVVKATDDNNQYIDAQKYLDDNYDNIKDKLDTYVYTFEVVNNKINLVDFSIK